MGKKQEHGSSMCADARVPKRAENARFVELLDNDCLLASVPSGQDDHSLKKGKETTGECGRKVEDSAKANTRNSAR